MLGDDVFPMFSLLSGSTTYLAAASSAICSARCQLFLDLSGARPFALNLKLPGQIAFEKDDRVTKSVYLNGDLWPLSY